MLGSSAKWLHGSSEGLAQALQAGSSKTVAVVGNGPISDRQRADISGADLVVRFNAMNNRQALLTLPTERACSCSQRHIKHCVKSGASSLEDCRISLTDQPRVLSCRVEQPCT